MQTSGNGLNFWNYNSVFENFTPSPAFDCTDLDSSAMAWYNLLQSLVPSLDVYSSKRQKMQFRIGKLITM